MQFHEKTFCSVNRHKCTLLFENDLKEKFSSRTKTATLETGNLRFVAWNSYYFLGDMVLVSGDITLCEMIFGRLDRFSFISIVVFKDPASHRWKYRDILWMFVGSTSMIRTAWGWYSKLPRGETDYKIVSPLAFEITYNDKTKYFHLTKLKTIFSATWGILAPRQYRTWPQYLRCEA